MKKLFLFVLLVFTINNFAQVITSIPEFPTENDSITIVFNVEEASNTSLVGYTGTVYTHTGVYTNLNSTDWQHVIGSWGDNAVQPALTRLGTNLYQLVISEPRNFYNVISETEHITQLNFVLRSADGSIQTEDLFLPVYEEGLNVKITHPTDDLTIVKLGDQLNITVTSNLSDTLKLFLDNNLLTQTTGVEINYTLNITDKGKKQLIATAQNESSVAADSVLIFVRGEPNVEDVPSGTIEGINYIDDNTVTLNLFAPNKEYVYIIGDFNNWEVDSNYQMNKTPNDSTFWLTLTNLVPQQEYRFQYLIDGNLRIADPYADKILEKEDSQISEATYPNLISYPYNKTDYSVSVFETAQTPFQWEAINYQRPEKENLIIYELLIRDFVAAHDYRTLIDTLDYLENLGINAIELMPVNEFEGNESWGYNPSFYFAPDKYYGTKNDLKKFIDECHKRNIAVILDIVLNHTYGRSPFVRMYASGPFGPPTSENPWYNITSPNPVFSWGYDLNHESEVTKKLVDRVNRYWLEEYKFDGYRFDFTKGFTNTPGDGGGFDQSRINILKRMADKIWEFDSTAYVILEHFAPDTEEQILTNYGMMVWGNNNYNYNEATMGYNQSGKSNFKRISYKEHGFSNPNLVGYMESHDEERLMYKNLQYGNSGGAYNIKELNTALSRIKLAAAFFITVPGPKMIWQFGELGYDYSIDYNGRVGNKPIRWDYLDNPDRKNLYKTFSALNYLKTNYEAFSTTDFLLAVNSSNKLIHLNHESMNVLIIGNFGINSSTVIPNFQHTGIWYNYFSDDSLNVTSLQSTITLEPGEFHIFTTKKLPAPEPGILLDIKIDNTKLVEKFNLYQNYPNPFNPTTTIKYSIPSSVISNPNEANDENSSASKRISPHGRNKNVNVTLIIYDILGREIATLVNKQQQAGSYKVQFDASRLNSGVYFYKLKAGGYHQTKKMVILK